MKHFIVTICFLFISLSGLAQEKKSIIGKWTYKEIYEKEKLEKENLEMTEMMFKDFSLDFKENELTLTLMGKSEPAQWSFDAADSNIINTISKTGKKAKLVIIKMDEKELIIELGKTPFVLLKS